jgi:hypothetical protein
MHKARDAWHDAGYAAELIEKLEWNKRYSIVELLGAQYAFSDYAAYLSGLNKAWDAGHVPIHGPGFVAGIDLPAVAPRLRGVDGDLELHLQDSLGRDPRTP